MLRQLTLLSAATLLITANVSAYQYEIDLNRSETDGRVTELRQTGIDGTYYFKSVDSKNLPLAEAAFVSQASSVSLGYQRFGRSVNTGAFAQPAQTSLMLNPMIAGAIIDNPNLTSFPAFGFALPSAFTAALFQPDPDSNRYNARFRHVLESDWFVAGSISKESASAGGGSFRRDLDDDEFNAEIGRYIRPLTTVSVAFARRNRDSDSQQDQLFCLSIFAPCTDAYTFSTRTENEESRWSAALKHMMTRGKASHVFDGRIAYAVTEFTSRTEVNPIGSGNVGQLSFAPLPSQFSNKSYLLQSGVNYTFYPMTNLGFGIAIHHVDSEFSSSNSVTAHGQWFFREDLAFNLSFGEVSDSSFNSDADFFEFGFTGRF